ncbi:ATP-grasp domain-containing protein [Halobacterium sp. MBLA0001]|uniref:ATP-grasp domain-containing protein n=1 Tax=Halobacterium TaxID=2239 RepID=UPI0025529472|nr:RimK family alpha-L-glutamate ligase [Halobacterium salinarum]MDL0124717.1 RimK family alpha-L-glutamate ligase [Halobacterium salinarum]MDL0127987.1 RimK family alpha-L-glutamate ligase [Halobacterium salinarum]MDL0133743.1 RimK family alpha-L-glutamate ligase [Halobacterium salinarum]MDL0137029.1 RimK family alpha-L-glutamate ligase [Halobacterium salinarum]
MLGLAVANDAETFARMQEPLAERGVRAEHVTVTGSVTRLDAPPVDADRFDAGFVYPGRLMEGGVVDAFIDVPWVNGREAVLRSRNKAGALALLSDAGVPVPETVYVSNPADEDAVRGVFEALEPPVVVKPNSATRGVGVTKVSDPDSLDGVTDYLELVHDYRATGDKSYLIQAFVPDATDYRVMVLDGQVVGAVRRDSAGWKHNVHQGATAAGVSLPDRLRALAVDAAAALDVSLLGVDVLATDERAVVVETNARPTIDDTAKYEAEFYDRLAALVRRTAGDGRA